MEHIRMMIVDGDADSRRALTEYFKQNGDITIVATAGDGAEALELTKTVCPDTVLLDLVLPKKDGFYYLERIHRLPCKRPNVIVASAAFNDELIIRAMSEGASFYMAKPLNYPTLTRRIIEFGGRHPDVWDTAFNPPESRASRKLTLAGMPAKMQGFDFLVTAIGLIECYPDMIHKLTKELYPNIAKNRNTHPKNVERSIRNAIDAAWKRGSLRDHSELFGLSFPLLEKPTNGEFIALLYRSLKSDQYN